MLTLWAVRSYWRRLLCLITGRKPRVEGHCLQCGRCCREIVICDSGHWIRTQRQFHALLQDSPGYERMEPVGRDDDGRITFSCSWLGRNGSCLHYEDRLPLCRDHPGPILWLRGVDLPRTCGYRLTGPSLFGFMRRERPLNTVPFRDVLEQERARKGNAALPRSQDNAEADEGS